MGRQSRRHKIALKVGGSRPAGLRDLGFGLNALHHHHWSEAQGEVHYMREAVTTVGRWSVIVEEQPVDLHDIEVDQLDEPWGSKSSSKAIEGDPAPHRPEVGNRPAHK